MHPSSDPRSSSRLRREEASALIGLIALFAITAAWWSLAFWPVQNGPAWLERTRYVCFGVGESGLPDGGGWIGLTAGPIGMLTILLAGWGGGVRSLFRRARTSIPVAGTLAALGIGSLCVLAGAAVRVSEARAARFDAAAVDDVVPATYPRLDRDAPPLALTAQDGGTRSLEQLRGQPVLVTFAFAHCATICPVVVKHALQAQQLLASAGDRAAVLVVTLDPWRDTPSRLPSIAAAWSFPDTGAWVLSGSVDDVEAALDAWDVPRSRDTRTGDVTHPSLVYIIGRDGRIAYAATGGAATLATLVRRLD